MKRSGEEEYERSNTRRGDENKVGKQYKRLPSQGQGHVKKKKAYTCRNFSEYCLLCYREHATLILLHLPTHFDLASR